MRKYYPYLFIAILAIASYIQSLKFYFWHDDYTVFYYLQQSTKIWFPFHAYYYLGKPLYSLFELNPVGYHFSGLILHLSASILLYVFLNKLTKNKKAALLASLIFSSGYIGQEAMKMYVSVGTTLFFGINTFLLSLIFLHEYFTSKNRNKSWLISSIIFFFLTIELAPHRYPGLMLAVIALWWFMKSSKSNIKTILLYLSIFLLEYIVKPTRFIFQYPLASPGTTLKVDDLITRSLTQTLENLISIKTVTNFLGTLWNLFFPTYFQTEYFFLLSRNLSSLLHSKSFLLVPIPSLLLTGGVLLLLRKQFLKRATIIFSIAYFWSYLITKSTTFSIEQISIVNGGILLLLFSFAVIEDKYKNARFFVFSIIMTISTLGLVLIFNQDSILESEHRYLFPSAIIPSLFVILLANKRWHNFLFLTIFLMCIRLAAGILSQKDFIEDQSQDAKRFFAQLSANLKNLQEKSYISLEGETKDISFKIADSMRVGAMASEASVAVHLGKSINSIVLLNDPIEILDIRAKNNINLQQIHRFIYDGVNFKDISKEFRELIENPKEIILLNKGRYLKATTTYYKNEGYNLGVYPNTKIPLKEQIPSQLPLYARLQLKAKIDSNLPLPYLHMHYAPEFVSQPNIWREVLSWRKSLCTVNTIDSFDCVKDEVGYRQANLQKNGEIEFIWKYNTDGPVGQNKSTKLKIPLDGKPANYDFQVPAGGEYLIELAVDYMSFPGEIEISNFSLSYSK